MKLIFKRSWIALAALLAAGLQFSVNAATPVSPLLTNSPGWDCLLSGKDSQQGVMFLTFENDGYGSGFFYGALAQARVKAPIAPDNDRSPIGDIRNPTNSPATVTSNMLGYVSILGNWAYDYQGYIVGSFNYQVLISGTATNTVTNQFSFKAKVASNRRLTASYSTTLGGNGTFKGIPMKTVTNVAGITGSWTGVETSGTVSYYEWFQLSDSGSVWPNLYAVDGYGPAYDLIGYCLVSSQKRIAFGNWRANTVTTDTNTVTYYLARGSVGPLTNKKTIFGGKTRGLNGFNPNVLKYDAFRVAQ